MKSPKDTEHGLGRATAVGLTLILGAVVVGALLNRRPPAGVTVAALDPPVYGELPYEAKADARVDAPPRPTAPPTFDGQTRDVHLRFDEPAVELTRDAMGAFRRARTLPADAILRPGRPTVLVVVDRDCELCKVGLRAMQSVRFGPGVDLLVWTNDTRVREQAPVIAAVGPRPARIIQRGMMADRRMSWLEGMFPSAGDQVPVVAVLDSQARVQRAWLSADAKLMPAIIDVVRPLPHDPDLPAQTIGPLPLPTADAIAGRQTTGITPPSRLSPRPRPALDGRVEPARPAASATASADPEDLPPQIGSEAAPGPPAHPGVGQATAADREEIAFLTDTTGSTGVEGGGPHSLEGVVDEATSPGRHPPDEQEVKKSFLNMPEF